MNYLSVRIFRYAVPAFSTLFLLAAPVRGQGDAANLYKTKCSACHGTDGSGNTDMGKKLKIKDLRSPEVQKQSDPELNNYIAKGKSPMPAYEKTLKPEEIQGLVAFIRTLAKK
jgi:mono/diheme cytochrome c family protein